jgi:hypothetical protein
MLSQELKAELKNIILEEFNVELNPVVVEHIGESLIAYSELINKYEKENGRQE